MPRYIARERVKHSITGQYYSEGEIVPVDHLSKEQLEMLIDRKVLRIEEPSVQPVGPVIDRAVDKPVSATPAETEPITTSAKKKKEIDNG